MTEKLILPAEVKVCATCSYWDGKRHVDREVRVVVVAEHCEGECLAQGKTVPGLYDVRRECDCIWESLGPDDERPAQNEALSEVPPSSEKADGLVLGC